MAVLEEGLFAYLSSYSALVAYVGTRIYPDRFTQDTTLPCLVYTRVSTPRELTHDAVGATGTLAHPRFQFEIWTETSKEGKLITDVLRAALNGKKGSIGAGAISVTIRAALIDDESTEYISEFDIYRTNCEYIIWHEE